MSARRQIIAALSEDSLGGIATLADVAHAEQLVNALVVEVRLEDADFVGNDDTCDCGGCDTCIPRQLADGLRTMAGEKATAPTPTATAAQAGATTVPSVGPAHEWPDDWEHVLDTAIRAWGGEWSPKRVQRLYLARYARGLYRSDARNFLSQLAHQGVLLLHDRPTGRHYTLNTTKGGTR